MSGFDNIFQIIQNIVLDPILSCKLTNDEICKYFFFNTIQFETIRIRNLSANTPKGFRNKHFNFNSLIHEISNIQNNKTFLKKEYLQYCNTFFQYEPLPITQEYHDKYLNEYNYQKPMIFKLEKRDETLHKHILQFIDMKEILDLCLLILQVRRYPLQS